MTSAQPDAMQPASFRDIIARWPTTRAFARDAGSSPTLVRQWRHRNSVPAPYWQRIVEGAGRRGIVQVDIGLLARLAASRRGNGGQR
ncbi:MAG TPA: hypothetical protein VFZ03_07610 [Dongiaceae bacterium]